MAAIEDIVAEGKSYSQIQRERGISRSTWADWRADGKFLPALEEARKDHQEGVWNRIRGAAEAAARVLVEIATNEDEKGSVRLMAASSILDRAGFKTPEPTPAGVQPYSTREELLQALRAMPADVLQEALTGREQVAHYVGVVTPESDP